jgi:hypothetical protein
LAVAKTGGMSAVSPSSRPEAGTASASPTVIVALCLSPGFRSSSVTGAFNPCIAEWSARH